MNVKTIPRSEFDLLLPCPLVLESLMGEQLEWFSNGSGTMVGAIAKGTGVAGWNYAILKRDKAGGFHIRKVMSNFFNVSAARVDLFLSMAEIGKFGCVPHCSELLASQKYSAVYVEERQNKCRPVKQLIPE